MRGFRFPTLAIGLLLALLNSSAQQPRQAPLTLPQQQPATSTAATLPPAPEQIRSTVGFLMVAYQNGPAQGGVIGTRFFVWVPDTRLGENKGFVYLVTNRHVAQPGIDLGQPYQVRAVYLRMNLATPEQGIQSVAGEITLNDQVHWFFPSDDAADLAILPLAPDQKRFAYLPPHGTNCPTRCYCNVTRREVRHNATQERATLPSRPSRVSWQRWVSCLRKSGRDAPRIVLPRRQVHPLRGRQWILPRVRRL